MMTRRGTTGLPFAVVLALSAGALLTGARGDGCGSAASGTPAPDFTGTWDVTYADQLAVTINLGGAIYTEELELVGGVITIDHEGTPLTFNLDCSLEAVVCPSEILPASVAAAHDEPERPHQVYVTIPGSECSTDPVDADPMQCGEGTLNPDCDPVCDGEVVMQPRRALGLVDEAGDTFDMLLGAGVATNSLNCALLSLSTLSADVTTSGSEATEDWSADSMNGEIVVGYAGGCIWVAETVDESLEAAAIGATIEIRAGFTATKTTTP